MIVIKSLLLPKVVYTLSLLPTPKNIIKELNHLKILWKSKDKITRKSAMNDYEGGGIKMVNIESMIESLRLDWPKRAFWRNSGAWKKVLEYLLKETGGMVIFKCNYNVKDLTICSQFYMELLKCWSELRKHNAVKTNWLYKIRNNQEIRETRNQSFIKDTLSMDLRQWKTCVLILITSILMS